MNVQDVMLLLAATALPFALGTSAAASTPYKVSEPVTHENLSVYFIRGASAAGPVPLTLQEALANGTVTMRETGRVNELILENAGSEAVFIQAGDIVKGGKQDRVLSVSLLVEPRSGAVPIGAYCVEQGRWAARGKEDVGRFASADQAVPSKSLKLAFMAPAKPQAPPLPRTGSPGDAAEPRGSASAGLGNRTQEIAQQRIDRTLRGGDKQSEVWRNVRETQSKLAAGVNAAVAAPQSASSLQLSLENQKVAEAKSAYRTALLEPGRKDDDIIGYAIAINGRIASADIYPSNGLFRKMWSKQLEAGATEAIAEKAAASQPAPKADAVLAFLSGTEKGKVAETSRKGKLEHEVREAEASYAVETRASSGQVLHRSYLAK